MRGAGGLYRLVHRFLPGEGIVGHGKLHRLQPFDLVAQPRGLLELQILGRLAHLGAQSV